MHCLSIVLGHSEKKNCGLDSVSGVSPQHGPEHEGGAVVVSGVGGAVVVSGVGGTVVISGVGGGVVASGVSGAVVASGVGGAVAGGGSVEIPPVVHSQKISWVAQ